MLGQLRKTRCCSALLIAPLCVLAAPAAAQSLALSHKLEIKSDSGQQAASVVQRCTGLSWLTSLGACGRDLLARIAPTARSHVDDTQKIAVFSMLPSGPEAGGAVAA